LRYIVTESDGFFELVELDEMDNGGEEFFLQNWHVGGGGDEGGAGVAAAEEGLTNAIEFDGFAAEEDFAALLADVAEGFAHFVDGVLVDEGAAEGAGVEGVTDADFFPCAEKVFAIVVGDGALDEDAADGGAALAGGTDGTEEEGGDGVFGVGVGHDDGGVVAAEFEEGATEAAANDCGDASTDGGGAGGGDEGKAAVGGHAFADDGASTADEGEDAAEAVAGEDGVADFMDGDGGEGGLFAGLPDDAVTTDGGEEGVPTPDGDGEVKGCNAADDAERVPLLHHAVARAFAGHGEAVELAREADGKVGGVDHLLDFAFGFGENFAGFEGDEGGEVVERGAEGVGDFAEDETAAGGGVVAPGGPDALSEIDGVVVVFFGAEEDRCEFGTVGGGENGDGFARGAFGPFVVGDARLFIGDTKAREETADFGVVEALVEESHGYYHASASQAKAAGPVPKRRPAWVAAASMMLRAWAESKAG